MRKRKRAQSGRPTHSRRRVAVSKPRSPAVGCDRTRLDAAELLEGFDILFSAIRGRLGDHVFKTYGDKIVVTRVPCFDGYQPSAAQRDRRERMRAATAYARAVYADPSSKAVYVAAAKQLGRQPFRLAVSDFLRGRTRVPVESGRRVEPDSAVVRGGLPARQAARTQAGRTSIGVPTASVPVLVSWMKFWPKLTSVGSSASRRNCASVRSGSLPRSAACWSVVVTMQRAQGPPARASTAPIRIRRPTTLPHTRQR
jgi:hypothetical protein